MEYIIAIFIVILGILYNKKMSQSVRKAYLGLILIYIILLIGFRYRVGIDTINYMRAYPLSPLLHNFWNINIFNERFEPGYLLICAICKLFSKDFWLSQLVMTAITNCCVFIFLFRYCKNPFIGIFIYFILQWLYFSTEIIRESVAIGIFLLNYRNIERKRWVKYYLLSLLSIFFHYSAIIIWFIPLAKFIKFNIYYLLACCILLAITPIVERLNALLSIAAVAGRIDQYVASAETLNLNWRVAEFIKSAFPAIGAVVLLTYYKINYKFKPIALLQILFCAGAFAIPIIFSRFTNYTSIFIIVIISNLLDIHKIKLSVRVLFVGFILMTQLNYYYKMYRAWIPYISIFDPQHIRERESLWWEYNH